MMERETIVVAMPGLQFSNVFVSNWTSLLSHLLTKYKVQVVFGFSNNIYITRNVILENLYSTEAQLLALGQEKPDYILWMDDDNILTCEQLDLLVEDLHREKQLDGVMGWYWLQPHGYQIEPIVSCGVLDGVQAIAIEPKEMFRGEALRDVEYGGMGAWLVRWDSLKELGLKSFAPIPLYESQWGFAGNDVSFFMRAKGVGQRYKVDKRIKVPHLKIRNADFDSSQFIEPLIKPALAIDGWMTPEELNWMLIGQK